jgi:hypothetical protein
VPVTSAAFDAEAAASTVMAALRPLADPERAGQAKRYRPRRKGGAPVVKDAIQRSFRVVSANPE